ncbi:aminotransferase class I/II-fold pyridoxal phosphate-dependent enzyme [Streptomyces hainanensis]|uniref:Aminotransferase class I/II-fold pyridoxal phosphate-dependent enzyme n=1 Tax=Streptomyces hainanensis TaxID=402648 RepID=A0A4R4SUH8_9ACTN|nr:aminotransferase class I/II-fold pyridoxal phosphate-dependent enzyme [Streptomyces hainanensis]TDC67818.1 aminotransferase class I/II-fold pyridoxal phosphate-dependent enzyme [Streptomyces hainanensis]
MLGEYRIEGRRAAEIFASVERGVSDGALLPGQLLPSLRELADQLGVNPNTVAAAYRSLRDRGVVETAGRRGTRVRARPASSPRDAAAVEVPPGVRDLSQGNPDPALLPPLGPALAAAAERAGRSPMLYGGPPMAAELARAARASFDADGVPAGPLVVTSGALDTIERVLQAWLRPGDAVAVEDPGWGSLLDLVAPLGLRPLPVSVDDEGPRPGSVRRALRSGARALIVTSRAQNPTGAAVSAARAAELRAELAEHPDVLLIEDDHGHGIVGLPYHPLVGGGTRWAVIRSSAKALGPDLRVAVCTGDPVTVDRVQGRLRLGPGWVSHLLQDAVAELWRARAAADIARGYDERRAALLRALAAHGVAAHGRSGLNVWVPVPDETAAITRLLRAGWAAAPGARFRIAAPPGMRLTVSPLAAADVEPLAAAVAAAVRPPAVRRYD